jgi:hypothetical protein
MSDFSYAASTVTVAPPIADSHREAWEQLAGPGTWWTAEERLAIAERARTRFAQRGTPPWLRPEPEAGAGLGDEACGIVDTLATDAGAIDRDWAEGAIAAMGDGPYVEAVAVVATVVMVDVFAEAVGVEPTPLPRPRPGQPTRERPDGLGDIGAYVSAIDPFPAANVARALSLVPAANRLFRTVSVPAYSAPGFADLEWDTPLSRPQVELVASRVAAMNECFY